jgi:hypothetical protein
LRPKQVIYELGSQIVHLSGRPITKALSCLKPKSTGGHVFLEEFVWPGMSIQLRNNCLVNIEREIKTDQIGILKRSEHGQAQAETVLYTVVQRSCIADALGHHSDSLSPQGVLQPIRDETG